MAPTPKDPKFKSKAAAFSQWELNLEDKALEVWVYVGCKKDKKCRVVVDGQVIYALPATNTAPYMRSGAIWSNDDLEWDSEGCLVITNADLGECITEGKAQSQAFNINVNNKHIAGPGKNGHGGGDNKVNAMCPC